MSTEKLIYDAMKDPTMQDSYIDADEQRERILPDGTVLPYRYVHGGFRRNSIKFIFCFPPKEQYQGRFFQYLSPFPGPDEELASLDKTGEDDKIAFCLLHGAYYVESNMGSAAAFGDRPDPKMCFKASAAAAEFSRKVAMEYYGCSRPYGYVHGGSGGGYKTMACIENTNAWDGAVPYVIGSPVSLPNTVTMHVKGQRDLRNVFERILDNIDAGGSGNMYDGLNGEEAATLRELTRFGFPPLAWFFEAWGVYLDGSVPVLLPGIKKADPGYFTDFWTVPGYEGADPASTAARDRLVFSGKIRAVHVPSSGMEDNGASNGVDDSYRKMLVNGKDAWIELEQVPKEKNLYLKGVEVCITSGEAAGKQMLLDKIIPDKDGEGGILTIGMCYGMTDLAQVIQSIKPGDALTLDNSDYIAIQSYYRHQVPEDRSFHAWDQFRDEEGNITIPQRDRIIGYGYCGTGTVQDGNIQGKVIVVQALMDESTCSWCADWYRKKIAEAKGGEENHVRVYYMERCMHGDLSWLENNMVTNYLGAMRQALLDLSDWVERGIEPRPTTSYRVEENQIIVPERAAQRRGLQPTIQLTANEATCARIKAGDTVSLRAQVQVPEGAGTVTHIDFDFEEVRNLPLENAFSTEGTIHPVEGGYEAVVQHCYDKPGTYFASARVKAERNGDGDAVFTQIRNLARARVIVE